MRTARLVGLSPDGKSLIVATDGGEELWVAADDRLRAAVRGDRPRLGQLENQMDSSLSPRDIQSRIRAGASVADLADSSGMSIDRVERFAAPVLAEREHVAATAMSSSVRRRGESSAHRNLRVTVTDRLHDRGVDIDAITWDACRREDGRWTVSADYQVEQDGHRAEFLYDPSGRFSVAGNDEATSLLGEQPAIRDNGDNEPTVNLDDELAIVRATREGRPLDEDGLLADEVEDDEAAEEEAADPSEPDPSNDQVAAQRSRAERLSAAREAAEPTVSIVRRLTSVEIEVDDQARPDDYRSELDTLYEMLGGDGHTEDSVRVYPGLSDASAVPVVDDFEFEPAPGATDFPVEPVEEPAADPGRDDVGPDDPKAPLDADERARPTTAAAQQDEPTQDALIDGPTPPKKPVRRKRAAVPSWDEIMFGGPKKG